MASPVISDESAWAPSMPEPSVLPAFFRRVASTGGEFVAYDDGYRRRSWSYAEVARMAEALRRRFRGGGFRAGDAVMIWSESRPSWIAALWACLLEGLVVVPVEPRSSREWFDRIRERVRPKLILHGERVPEAGGGVPVWGMGELEALRFVPRNLRNLNLAERRFDWPGATGYRARISLSRRPAGSGSALRLPAAHFSFWWFR